MKQTFIDFIKKYKGYFILGGIIILLIIFLAIRNSSANNLASEKAKVEQRVEDLQAKINELVASYSVLVKKQAQTTHEKDSIKAAQDKQEAYFKKLISENKAKIDSLLNIPVDSVYKRLQPIYPNYSNEPLIYPFAGGQIRQIYSTAVRYPMLEMEFTMQGSILNTCNSLNKKYVDSENNYLSQIGNLSSQVSGYKEQIGLKDKDLKLTQKQLNRKGFWNWVYKGGLIAAGIKIVFFK